MDLFIGSKEYFKGIGKIPYEGKGSDNPLAFKWYDENKLILGKPMREHLRFSIAYWHSFCADGTDPFGASTLMHPWKGSGLIGAEQKADAAFEFFSKLGTPYYCFHDVDVSPEGVSLVEYEKNLKAVTLMLKERQDATGIKLLWNTANLFTHPRYMNGAATNPEFPIIARAAAQVKACLDANVILGGEGYTFWGGREGYMSLLNTMVRREQEHLAQFLIMARDYGRSIGFKGKFYIEPKPMEPSKHQYDYDGEIVVNFIKANGLEEDFACNIEANHATLAGHSFEHDLQIAADHGLLGSVDANRGDPQNGWDTDQFPNSVAQATEVMRIILAMGGFTTGGLNFDAKIRRNSTDMEDLFLAHIGGMDTFALGLEIAAKIHTEGRLESMKRARYESFDSGKGKEFELGKLSLEDLVAIAHSQGEPVAASGKQELYENILREYIHS